MAARAAARVGATAIHEKALTRAPAEALSILLHGSFGIDHYGGSRYLNKLEDSHLEQLHALLATNLQVVQSAIDARAALRVRAPAIYPPPLPPVDALFSLMNKPLLEALAPFIRSPLPSAGAALQSPPSSRAIGAVMRHLTEEADGVYSFELFSPALVEQILAAGRAFSDAASEEFLQAGAQRNQVFMRYEPSLAALERELLTRVVAPLGRLMFPEVASNVDFGHGYLIGYAGAASTAAATATGSAGADSIASAAGAAIETFSGPARPVAPESSASSPSGEATASAASSGAAEAGAAAIPALLSHSGLRPHTDDSEVTLNVSLGRPGMAGGELVLRGRRNSASAGAEEAVIAVRAGRAILHAGQHLHEVRPVTAGERYALILWGRDGSYRARTCPCCLINRRNAHGRPGSSSATGGPGSSSAAPAAAATAVAGDCICDAAFN